MAHRDLASRIHGRNAPKADIAEPTRAVNLARMAAGAQPISQDDFTDRDLVLRHHEHWVGPYPRTAPGLCGAHP